MNYYNTIEEKEKYFITGNLVVNKFSDLINTLEELNKYNHTDVLFRGHSEAKYMLYSSLQRLWIEKRLDNHYNSYRELIDNLINNSKKWNNELISKYLQYTKSENNDISTLSLMQHYGVPTPLLDFTLDINKALYFATENIDLSPEYNEIGKYFSVYYIFKNNSVLLMSDFILKQIVSYAKSKNLIKEKDLNSLMEFDLVLIDNHDEAYRIQNNLNILNQDGAFILNTSSTDSLEINYVKYIPIFNKVLLLQNREIKFPDKIGGCININKALTNQIRDFLKGKGIDKNSMYPDLNNLRIDCLNLEWEKFSTHNRQFQ